MPWSRLEGRNPANICDKCSDLCPCGDKGTWWDGKLTCKHGFIYTNDYSWDGDKAVIFHKLEGRKWWSYLIISDSLHAKPATNAI